MMTMASQLPKKQDDNVVEVSLGHVVLAFVTLTGTLAAAGLVIVFARDYLRHRQQKAILETATELIKTITDYKGGNNQWKGEQTESLSQTKK